MKFFFPKNISIILSFLFIFSDMFFFKGFLSSLAIQSQVSSTSDFTFSTPPSHRSAMKHFSSPSNSYGRSIDTLPFHGKSTSSSNTKGLFVLFAFFLIIGLTILFSRYYFFPLDHIYGHYLLYAGMGTLTLSLFTLLIISLKKNSFLKTFNKFAQFTGLLGFISFFLFFRVYPSIFDLFVISLFFIGIFIVLISIININFILKKKDNDYPKMCLLKSCFCLGFSLFFFFCFPFAVCHFIGYGMIGLSIIFLLLFVNFLSLKIEKKKSFISFKDPPVSIFLALSYFFIFLVLGCFFFNFLIKNLGLPVFITFTVIFILSAIYYAFFGKILPLEKNNGFGETNPPPLLFYSSVFFFSLLFFPLTIAFFILHIFSPFGSSFSIFLPMIVFATLSLLSLMLNSFLLTRNLWKKRFFFSNEEILLKNNFSFLLAIATNFFLIVILLLGFGIVYALFLQVPLLQTLFLFYAIFLIEITLFFFLIKIFSRRASFDKGSQKNQSQIFPSERSTIKKPSFTESLEKPSKISAHTRSVLCIALIHSLLGGGFFLFCFLTSTPLFTIPIVFVTLIFLGVFLLELCFVAILLKFAQSSCQKITAKEIFIDHLQSCFSNKDYNQISSINFKKFNVIGSSRLKNLKVRLIILNNHIEKLYQKEAYPPKEKRNIAIDILRVVLRNTMYENFQDLLISLHSLIRGEGQSAFKELDLELQSLLQKFLEFTDCFKMIDTNGERIKRKDNFYHKASIKENLQHDYPHKQRSFDKWMIFFKINDSEGLQKINNAFFSFAELNTAV